MSASVPTVVDSKEVYNPFAPPHQELVAVQLMPSLQHIQGLVVIVLDYLKHISLLDDIGVLQWIGTDNGTSSQWRNPAFPVSEGGLGRVHITTSCDYRINSDTETNPCNMAHSFCAEKRDESYDWGSLNIQNSWFELDLCASGISVQLLEYKIKNNEHAHMLRNWQLQAWSESERVWIVLENYVDDCTLNNDDDCTLNNDDGLNNGVVGHWILKRLDDKYYQRFRIYQTGVSSHGFDFLVCDQIELYGHIIMHM